MYLVIDISKKYLENWGLCPRVSRKSGKSACTVSVSSHTFGEWDPRGHHLGFLTSLYKSHRPILPKHTVKTHTHFFKTFLAKKVTVLLGKFVCVS